MASFEEPNKVLSQEVKISIEKLDSHTPPHSPERL